jgi:hypothetical protein
MELQPAGAFSFSQSRSASWVTGEFLVWVCPCSFVVVAHWAAAAGATAGFASASELAAPSELVPVASCLACISQQHAPLKYQYSRAGSTSIFFYSGQ